MDEQCKERVHSGRVSFLPCSRKAGFGPGAAYCAQHAKRHDKTPPTIELWQVNTKPYRFLEPTQVMAREVTANGYLDASGRRNNMQTEWSMTFQTRQEALAYLLTRLQQSEANHRAQAQTYAKAVQECSAALTRRNDAAR